MSEAAGKKRREPPFWDHQWYPLTRLRCSVQRLLDGVPPGMDGHQLVFDLGCGDRPYQPLIEARGYHYLGCDITGEPDILIRSGQSIDTGRRSAAGVVSFQVLEHVWDLDWYLGEARRLLTPGGWLLLSTHGVWLYHPHPTDYRRWTAEGLRAELTTRGFAVEHFESLLGPLAWSTQVRALAWRHALMLSGPMRIIAVPLLMAAMNARMVLEDAITPKEVRDSNGAIYVVLARAV